MRAGTQPAAAAAALLLPPPWPSLPLTAAHSHSWPPKPRLLLCPPRP